jgi:hypothetical protein
MPLAVAQVRSPSQARPRHVGKRALCALGALTLFVSFSLVPAVAQQPPVSFEGKSPVMLIGFAPGGGTDLTGRLIAQYIAKYLPGAPSFIVRNMPGADGLTAGKMFASQVAPDGLTITMGASTQADPLHYRKPQAGFDPTKFELIGGIGRGGTVSIINREAEKRLYDKTKPPVAMGSLSGLPRSGMQMTTWGIEFLGWNARWVLGYPSTVELLTALERGEIDMTAEGGLHNIIKFANDPRFKLLVQSGALENGKQAPRKEFGDTPLFASRMDGKIHNDVQSKAFAYWTSIATIDKWVALPPGTPRPIVNMYRDVWAKVMVDPEFIALGKRQSEDFTPLDYKDESLLMNTLGATPQASLDFINEMFRKQGLDTH